MYLYICKLWQNTGRILMQGLGVDWWVFFLFIFIWCMCMYVYVCQCMYVGVCMCMHVSVHAAVHMWRSGDNLLEPVRPLLPFGSRDLPQVIRLGGILHSPSRQLWATVLSDLFLCSPFSCPNNGCWSFCDFLWSVWRWNQYVFEFRRKVIEGKSIGWMPSDHQSMKENI